MKYIIKGLIAIYIILNFFISVSIDTVDLVLLFALFTVTLFFDTENKRILMYILALECFVVVMIGFNTEYVFYALLILVFDIMCVDMYFFFIILAGIFVYFECYTESYTGYLAMAIVACVGYIISSNQKSKSRYIEALDKERQTKYELEIAKADLIKSSNELQQLTKVNERNRIARDLHDNIGHKIAGVLINLQAANKLLDKDTVRGKQMVDNCIEHLDISLSTIRNTVHDMYSDDLLGINYLESIVNDFKYCNKDIISKGSFDTCPQKIFVILSYILKEALTNTAKHSMAENVVVEMSCEHGVVTMEVMDDGIGCENIHESLGIKSMRDRIKSIGGTIIIDGSDGMKIKCIIPYE